LKAKEKATGTNLLNDDFSGWSLTLNGKLYGLLGRVQPYAVFGIGGLVFDDKHGPDHGFVARLGGGLDIYITDNVVFDFEIAYAMPAGNIDDFQFATFASGLQYRY
jgi:opacity protein-like surface antigen